MNDLSIFKHKKSAVSALFFVVLSVYHRLTRMRGFDMFL